MTRASQRIPRLDATLPLGATFVGRTDASFDRQPSLVVVDSARVEVLPLVEGVAVVIGREPPADVLCESPFVSKLHASFSLQPGGKVAFRDLGSKNGVVFGGKTVATGELEQGEGVALGPVRVSVHSLDSDERRLPIAGHERFVSNVEDEVGRSRFFGRACAILHVRSLGGGSEGAVAPFVKTLLREVDRVAVYGPGAVEVLLPEQSLEDARVAAHTLVAARRDGLPSLAVGVASFPGCGSVEELFDVSRSAARRASLEERVVSGVGGERLESSDEEGDFIARSAKMRALSATIDRVAKSSVPVLVLGETGSGKEVVSRRLHDLGPRKTGKLISVNCGALPPQLLESTLFGHERGAFTGAANQQKGVFEAAHKGTVFLDEIGELSPAAQAALLRVLETKRLVRVGSTDEIPIDVRVIAATHRDLEEMATEGRFRQDLLFRLNTVTLEVPPLRERAQDIEPLARKFLQRLRADEQTEVTGFDPAVMNLLRSYTWPGNVRELRNAVDRAAVVASGKQIRIEDLPEKVASPRALASPTQRRVADKIDYSARMRDAESAILLEALARADGKQAAAATLLGLPLRTLKYRLAKLGIRKAGYPTGVEAID